MASVNFFEDSQRFCPFHDGWFTHTPAHTALSVQQFLTKSGMIPMPHPPYLPDLTLSKFFCLFPWMKKVLKEKRCADVEEVNQTKIAEVLKGIKSISSKTVLNGGKKS